MLQKTKPSNGNAVSGMLLLGLVCSFYSWNKDTEAMPVVRLVAFAGEALFYPSAFFVYSLANYKSRSRAFARSALVFFAVLVIFWSRQQQEKHSSFSHKTMGIK
jgi:hypothetical protein